MDSDASAKQRFKQLEIQAVVIRADGTREDLGTVSYWHRNPLRRMAFALKRRLINRK